MNQKLTDLVERVLRDMTMSEPKTEDVRALVTTVIEQANAISVLTADNEALELRLARANLKLEGVEPLSHLVQYAAEGSL